MKIRTGFVSNSSSSSFCVLGIEIDNKITDKIEAEEKALEKLGVAIHYAISSDDWRCVGIDVTTMKDDETPRQVKQRLVDALKTIGIEVDINKVDFIEDGGYL